MTATGVRAIPAAVARPRRRGGDRRRVRLAHVPFLAQAASGWRPARAAGADRDPADPTAAWTTAGGPVLWLGPDEWLVVGPPGGEQDDGGELGGADGAQRAAVDCTYRAVLECPARARTVLATACALDLHPRAWHRDVRPDALRETQVILHERTETTGTLVRLLRRLRGRLAGGRLGSLNAAKLPVEPVEAKEVVLDRQDGDPVDPAALAYARRSTVA